MEDDYDHQTQLTQGTQDVLDPRRMGRNNSGLSVDDVSDVVCILHPSTPAAFELVAETARRTPRHVLQHVTPRAYGQREELDTLEEDETFILDGKGNNQALDLAFRFSSRTVQPHLGFVIGRNPTMCDIVVSSDAHKRVSNMHFALYINDSGVLMLKDTSTNGTMVDDIMLKSKNNSYNKTRMISHGSIIHILSPVAQESLKFIVRIPDRTGHIQEYERKFEEYMTRQVHALARYRQEDADDLLLAPKLATGQQRQVNTSVKAPILQNQFGMRWSGGEKYNVVGHVGKGAFASVYQLATKHDGQLYAAKELEKRKFMKNGILDRKLENEMLIMQSIEHQSIVSYHEYQDVGNHLYIIMEFVPCGDLQQYLNEYGPLQESVAKQMATQVLDALDYLHRKQITHRDIKPDNILIASMEPDNFIIKLSDFGLSKVVRDNDTFLKTFCGTLLYCAPEVFPHYDSHGGAKGIKRPRNPPPSHQSNRFHFYSQAVDIWSFGAVLWYALCQKPPFEGVADNTGRGMFDKIMMTPLDPSDLIKHGVSDEAIALLVQMLNLEPAARPSPADCLRHEWFGGHQPSTRPQGQVGLGAIKEEHEANEESVDGPDVAGLSIHERKAGSHDSEVSLNSSDLNFFDPRQSKRFKPNDLRFGDDDEHLLDSSPELFESIPIMHEDNQHAQGGTKTKIKPPKLFGEISHSDLQNPVFGRRASGALGANADSVDSGEQSISDHSSQNAQRPSQVSFGASPSLYGAESMVREMKMGSPSSDEIEHDEVNKPHTPQTPSSSSRLEGEAQPSQETPTANPDATPRPGDSVPFSRQINIPIPPSFWYEPHDPSTHNIAYASKMSGHDFATNPIYIPSKDRPLPDTTTNSKHSDTGHDSITQLAPEEAEEPTSRPRYGRLTSTKDSFKHIVLNFNTRITSWGRQSGNTYVYPDMSDTRVPKTGIHVFFHGDGVGALSPEDDFTQLPRLYCGILTHSSNGLTVNGVQLRKCEKGGKQYVGVLHTGDEIEVWAPSNTRPGLKFTAEVYVGDGKEPRSRKDARLKILEYDDDNASPPREKTSEREKSSSVGDATTENTEIGGHDAQN